MDVKAFRKAEDQLAKALASVHKNEAKPDGKPYANAKDKVVEAALAWEEARQDDSE